MTWRTRAQCRTVDPDMFFDPDRETEALTVCNGCGPVKQVGQVFNQTSEQPPCPVRGACLAEALRYGDEYGIRGGRTEKQRRRMPRSQRGDPSLPPLVGVPPVLAADLWAYLEKPATRQQAAMKVGKDAAYVGRCLNVMVTAGLVDRYERQDRIGVPPVNWAGGARYWYRRVSEEVAA